MCSPASNLPNTFKDKNVWDKIIPHFDDKTSLQLSSTCRGFRAYLREKIWPLKIITTIEYSGTLNNELKETVLKILRVVYVIDPWSKTIHVEGDPFSKNFKQVKVRRGAGNSRIYIEMFFDEMKAGTYKDFTPQLNIYLQDISTNHLSRLTMQGTCTNRSSLEINIPDPDEIKLKQALKDNISLEEFKKLLNQARKNGFKPNKEFLNNAIDEKVSLELEEACAICQAGDMGIPYTVLKNQNPTQVVRLSDIVRNPELPGIFPCELTFKCWWNEGIEPLPLKPLAKQDQTSNRKNCDLEESIKCLLREAAPPWHSYDMTDLSNAQSHLQIKKLLESHKIFPSKELLFFAMGMDIDKDILIAKFKRDSHFVCTIELIREKGKLELDENDLIRVIEGDYPQEFLEWIINYVKPTKKHLNLYFEKKRPHHVMFKAMKAIIQKGGITLSNDDLEHLFINEYMQSVHLKEFGYVLSQKYFQKLLQNPDKHNEAAAFLKEYPINFEITEADLTIALQSPVFIRYSRYACHLFEELMRVGQLKSTLQHIKYAITNHHPFAVVYILLLNSQIKLTQFQLSQMMQYYQMSLNFGEFTNTDESYFESTSIYLAESESAWLDKEQQNEKEFDSEGLK